MCIVLIIVAVSLCKQLKVHLIEMFFFSLHKDKERLCLDTRNLDLVLLLQFNKNMSNLRGSTSETKSDSPYDYDLAVIGGGSGGMAAAKEAARNGARVRFSK